MDRKEDSLPLAPDSSPRFKIEQAGEEGFGEGSPFIPFIRLSLTFVTMINTIAKFVR